jgi:hypothetical protein
VLVGARPWLLLLEWGRTGHDCYFAVESAHGVCVCVCVCVCVEIEEQERISLCRLQNLLVLGGLLQCRGVDVSTKEQRRSSNRAHPSITGFSPPSSLHNAPRSVHCNSGFANQNCTEPKPQTPGCGEADTMRGCADVWRAAVVVGLEAS